MNDLLADWRLFDLQRELASLLSYAEQPQQEALSSDWAEATKAIIWESAGQAKQAARNNAELFEKIERARVLAYQFIGALTDNPALSTVPVDAWTLPTRRQLYVDLAAYVAEFKALTPPLAYAAHVAQAEREPDKPERGNAEPAAPVADNQNAAPVKLLIGWNEILDAIGRPDSDRGTIKSLCETYDGPITFRQGGGPVVDRDALVAWWNGLQDMIDERHRREQDRKAAVAGNATHAHGRAGTVAPEIGGSVKSRRKRPAAG